PRPGAGHLVGQAPVEGDDVGVGHGQQAAEAHGHAVAAWSVLSGPSGRGKRGSVSGAGGTDGRWTSAAAGGDGTGRGTGPAPLRPPGRPRPTRSVRSSRPARPAGGHGGHGGTAAKAGSPPAAATARSKRRRSTCSGSRCGCAGSRFARLPRRTARGPPAGRGRGTPNPPRPATPWSSPPSPPKNRRPP